MAKVTLIGSTKGGFELAWEDNSPEVRISVGMPLNDVYRQLKSLRPSRPMEVTFDPEHPHSVDVAITLTQDGIRLRFEPRSQQLRVIDLYDLSQHALFHRGVCVSSPKQPLNYPLIHRVFGPTHPVHTDPSTSALLLEYPHLTFEFDSSTHTPSDFSKPSTEALAAVRVYIHHSQDALALPAMPPRPLKYMDSFRATISSEGANTFDLTVRGKTLKLGDSAQHVMAVLGVPSSVFHAEDELALESTSNHYFYNYFALGLDVQFHGRSHTVVKFIAHTNLPGRPDFLIYNRCMLEIDHPTERPPSHDDEFVAIKNVAEPREDSPAVEEEKPSTPPQANADDSNPPSEIPDDSNPPAQLSKSARRKKKKKGAAAPPADQTNTPSADQSNGSIESPSSNQEEQPKAAPPQLEEIKKDYEPQSSEESVLPADTPWTTYSRWMQLMQDNHARKPAMNYGIGQHPFGASQIFADPYGRKALYEVSGDGFLCSVTLFS